MAQLQVKVLKEKPKWYQRYWWRFRNRIFHRLVILNIIIWSFLLLSYSTLKEQTVPMIIVFGISFGIFFFQDVRNLVVTIQIVKEIKRMYEEYLKEIENEKNKEEHHDI